MIEHRPLNIGGMMSGQVLKDIRKKIRPVILNLLMLTFGFATMSMYPDLQNTIRGSLGVREGIFEWSILAFTVGLFAAFFIGHSEFFEHHLKKGVAVATAFAAVPQILIPFVGNIHIIIVFRFIQGFVVAMVPLFSAQLGRILSDERPLAVGIVLSGIFLGGIFGSFAAGPLNNLFGWKATFILTGLLLIGMLIIWWLLTTEPEIEEGDHDVDSVWDMKFTWIWGFTFFPTIWVVFTIQGFLPSTGFEIGLEDAFIKNLHIILNACKVFWSIAIGYIAYKISTRKKTDRGIFDSYVHIMYASFIIAFAGLMLMVYALNNEINALFPFALFLTAGIQGVGPVFWSSPSLIYPDNLVSRGGFALGLLGNSANVAAPIVTNVLRSQALIYGWIAMGVVSLFGLVIAKLGMMQELPKKR